MDEQDALIDEVPQDDPGDTDTSTKGANVAPEEEKEGLSPLDLRRQAKRARRNQLMYAKRLAQKGRGSKARKRLKKAQRRN